LEIRSKFFSVASARAMLAQPSRDRETEFQHPSPHRFVGDVEPSFGQQFLDIAVAQGEPKIEPDRVLDDLGRGAMAAVAELSHAGILSHPPLAPDRVSVTKPDGGFSGGNLERPALQHLIADIRAGRIDIVVVYKVDRLTRSLADFARLVELFDAEAVSFVSVTQQFNTTSSMGRLTLNVLLSFAQFEREVTGERIRDKIAASLTGSRTVR
jgi:hypothetical protein